MLIEYPDRRIKPIVYAQEMGKAIKESRSEVEKCAWTIEYYADNGKIFSTGEVVNTDARKSRQRRKERQ